MFAPIAQKLQLQRAGVVIVSAFIALIVSACTPSEQPSPAATPEAIVGTPDDYCPNLPDVHTQDQLPDTYVQDYDLERGFECVPKEEVRERLAEMDRQHQETVAKATELVLGSQAPSEATAFDKTTKAIAYFCNHIGDSDAEMAARFVYNANYTPILPSQPGHAPTLNDDNGFEKMTDLVCGHLKSAYVPPTPPVVEAPAATVGV